MTRRYRKWPLLVRLPCILTVLPIWIARWTAQGTRDLSRSTYKGIQKRTSRARRRKTNKKATTYDVAIENPMPKVTERNQVQASILKLPLELRQQIYDLFFQQTMFLMHELYDDGYKLYATIQKIPHHIQGARLAFYPPTYHPGRPNGLLQLPLACRQIYCETIEYIYKKNTFVFGGYSEALLLPTLSIYPQKHMDTLRSLEFRFCIDILIKQLGLGTSQPDPSYERSVTSWTSSLAGKSRQRRRWIEFWTFLTTLPNLQKLHVTFTRLPGPDSIADDCVFWWIVAPLLQFNEREHLAAFEVDWQRNTKGWRLPEGWAKTVPFQLAFIPGGMASRRY